MIVNVHAAKTSLSKLIELAEKGEEVIIARAGKPAVRLTPVATGPTDLEDTGVEFKGRTLPSWLGSMKGEILVAPDAFDTDEELNRLFEDGPIFPPEEPKD